MLKKLMLLLIAVSFAQSAHASVTRIAVRGTLGAICLMSGIIFCGTGASSLYYDSRALVEDNDRVVDELRAEARRYDRVVLRALILCIGSAFVIDLTEACFNNF